MHDLHSKPVSHSVAVSIKDTLNHYQLNDDGTVSRKEKKTEQYQLTDEGKLTI